MRRPVRHDETRRLIGPNGELTDGAQSLAAQGHARPNDDHVRSRDGANRAIIESRDPGNARSVVESQQELRAHCDTPASTAHDAHEIGHRAAEWHEVDDRYLSVRAGEGRLEDERIPTISPRAPGIGVERGQAPAPIPGRAEQRGETRA